MCIGKFIEEAEIFRGFSTHSQMFLRVLIVI